MSAAESNPAGEPSDGARAAEPTAEADEGAPPKTGWQRARRWLVDLALLAIVFLAVSAWQERDLLPADAQPAPAVTLLDVDGTLRSLSDFEGRPVQLHFWATWCGVCRQQHGALNAVHASVDDDGPVLISVIVDSGNRAAVRAYADERGIEYPIWLDTGAVTRAFNVTAFPTNFYLDAEHRVVGRDVGLSTRWGMRWRLWRASRG